jgi:hypothetical protein
MAQAVNVASPRERKSHEGQQDNDGQTSGDEANGELAGGE